MSDDSDKAEAMKRLAQVQEAIKAGRFTIGNPAMTGAVNPHCEFFDNRPRHTAGMVVSWAQKGKGFGEITITVKPNGQLAIDAEGESIGFVVEQLATALAHGEWRE